MAFRKIIKHIPGAHKAYGALQWWKKRNAFDESDRATPQMLQSILVNQYQSGMHHSNISDAGFRCYSQFEEDGIILYVLAAIGMKTRSVVELCCGPGTECMATNLIINHGFKGYLIDGDDKNVRLARRFFARQKDCLLNPPVVSKAWITRDNINDIIKDMGAKGEVDLLSLDIDGNDYYVWEAISAISPRLCVFETHNIIPDGLSLTIPYKEDFCYQAMRGVERDFRSVSLAAMTKLSKAKGYRLIGGHRKGFNVFFLRDDIAPDLFPEVTVAQVQDNAFTRQEQQIRWPKVKHMPWVEV